MRINLTIAIATAALLGAGAAHGASFKSEHIAFQNIAGAIEIVTTSGDDIEISIRQGRNYRPITLRESDGVVYVDGDAPFETGDNQVCCGAVMIDELKKAAPSNGLTSHPVIKVTMPLRGDVTIENSQVRLTLDRLAGKLRVGGCYVYGETSDVDEAQLDLRGGSRLVMGDVKATLNANLAGGGGLRVGDVSAVDIDMAGAGDIQLGVVSGMLDISIAGSGTVRTARLDGPLTARIAGSGAVIVQSGAADRLRAIIDGSGSVFLGGVGVEPDVRLSSSAEVRMKAMRGRLTRHGAGRVYVDGEEISRD